MKPFAEVDRRTQVRRLRSAARRALADHGVVDAQLRLLQHDFNTTFRVTEPDGRRSALRINVNSAFGPDEVAAEAEWERAIAADTDVAVAEPIPTADGRVASVIDVAGLDRPRAVVRHRWLAGRDLGDPAPLIGLEALGEAAAALHDHAESWRSPTADRRPSLCSVLLGEPDRLTGDDPRLGTGTRAILDRALERVTERTAEEFAREPILIHADLHGWNARWHRRRLTVFDFDDCGWGTPLQDLAIATYYVRDRPGGEAALRRGYERRRRWPDHDPAVFEALVAARNLVLLNDVLAMVTADLDDFVPGYAERTAGRLERYLETGRFELST